MEKSTSIKNIAKALSLFQVKVDVIKKDSKNPFFKSSYASLSNILETINIPLSECGLSISQFPSGDCGLTTIIMHSDSGEFIQAEYNMKPAKDDPQGRGSVITYQRRYALASVLCLNIEDDDDANTGTHGGKTPETIELPWLNENSTEFKGAVEKMKAGTSSVEALRKYFKISKAMETKLLEASKVAHV